MSVDTSNKPQEAHSMNMIYTLRNVLTGETVGNAHASQKDAEEQAQGLAGTSLTPHAVIENLVWENGHSEGVMSIVGATGVLLRMA